MNPLNRFIEWISDCYTSLKPFILMVFAWIVSVLSPIEGAIVILGFAATLNFCMGLGESIHVSGGHFNIGKAFDAIIQLTYFLAFALLVNLTFTKNNDASLAETGVKWITYIVVYFYSTNSFRNASLLWPNVKAFQFMYDLLSTAIFYKLKETLGIKKNDNNKQ